MSKVIKSADVKREVLKAVNARNSQPSFLIENIESVITMFDALQTVIDPITLWRNNNGINPVKTGPFDGGQHVLKGLLGSQCESNYISLKAVYDCFVAGNWEKNADDNDVNALIEASTECYNRLGKKGRISVGTLTMCAAFGRVLVVGNDGRIQTSGNMPKTASFTAFSNRMGIGKDRRLTQLENKTLSSIDGDRKAAKSALTGLIDLSSLQKLLAAKVGNIGKGNKADDTPAPAPAPVKDAQSYAIQLASLIAEKGKGYQLSKAYKAIKKDAESDGIDFAEVKTLAAELDNVA